MERLLYLVNLLVNTKHLLIIGKIIQNKTLRKFGHQFLIKSKQK